MSQSTPFVIALDGPAGSGKSTVGPRVAEELGFFYLDTGVLYRAATWLALHAGAPLGDGPALAALVQAARIQVRPPSVPDGRQADVVVNGTDISWDIRSPRVDAAVSQVSAHPEVRAALRVRQREAISPPGTILAGRDIGTVIASDAPLKIWLGASPAERARRRALQTGADADAVLADMLERDRKDSSRAVAPMTQAPDAVAIDTDHLTPDQVVAEILALATARGARPAARDHA